MIQFYSTKRKGAKAKALNKIADQLSEITENQREAVIECYLDACKAFFVVNFSFEKEWRQY